MNTEQLQAALAECATAYREKMGKRPFSSPGLALITTRGWRASFYSESVYQNVNADGDCPEAAINGLLEKIKDLPDPRTLTVREFHVELGALIDKGRLIGLDAKHIDPLVQAARDMADSAPEMKVAE